MSGLHDDDDTSHTAGPSNDDWITVSKPKPAHGKGGKNQGKGKNNSTTTYKASSFINICKNFQDFLIEARASKGHTHDPSTLFGSISHL